MAQVESHEAPDFNTVVFLDFVADVRVFLQLQHVEEAEGNRGGG